MRSTGPLMLFTSFAKTQNLRPASLASERDVMQKGANMRMFLVGFLITIVAVLFSHSLNGETKTWEGDSKVFTDDLLDKMVGKWDLKGLMGNKELHQSVSVEWTLNHQFLKIHTIDFDKKEDKSSYESLYYIGWSKNRKKYVMHLIDTFGGDFSETLGIGTKNGKSICFEFNYKDGPFENIFYYDSQNDSWEMKLKFKENNEWKDFATKNLKRETK